MDGWIVGIIVAVAQTVVTTIVGTVVGFFVKNKLARDKKEKEELETLREEARAQSEANRCNLVKQAIHEEVENLEKNVKTEFANLRKDFNGELKGICDDIDLMKGAMQKDIRRSLREDGRNLVQRGWASQQEKTEFDELYWAYHNLGRNGVVDALHDQVMHLPEMKPVRKKQKLNEDK